MIYTIVHVSVSYGLELSRYVPLILESVSGEFIAGRIVFPVARMRNLCGLLISKLCASSKWLCQSHKLSRGLNSGQQGSKRNPAS